MFYGIVADDESGSRKRGIGNMKRIMCGIALAIPLVMLRPSTAMAEAKVATGETVLAEEKAVADEIVSAEDNVAAIERVSQNSELSNKKETSSEVSVVDSTENKDERLNIQNEKIIARSLNRVDETWTHEAKFRLLIEESFADCTVCHSIEEHKLHMTTDKKMLMYLNNPDVYFEEEAIQKARDILGLDDDTDELVSDEISVEQQEELAEENVQADEEQVEDEQIEDAQIEEEQTEDNSIEEVSIEENQTEEVETDNNSLEEDLSDDNSTDNTDVSATSEDDLDILYKLVEAEAGIESSRCKEMVAAVVFNRVKSDRFPNTLRKVIYAPGAFAVTNNNVINRVNVTQDTIDAVNRVYNGEVEVPDDIYFFRNKHYFGWCKPAFSIDRTYFSKFK